MRTAVLVGPKEFKIEEIAIPKPADNQVLIKVAACGVCYSEMGSWEGTFGDYPKRIGHEISGIVVELGKNVTEFKEGQKVTAYIDEHGYSEYVAVNADCVIPVADHISLDHAIGEPIGCVINGARRAGIKLGDTVVLVGVGFMGLIMLQVMRSLGASRVICVDTRDEALGQAQKLGADHIFNPLTDNVQEEIQALTNGEGADVVIELTGNQQGLDLSTELVKVRGRLVIFGFHVDERKVNMFLWNWRGIDVINAHERAPEAYTDGIRVGMKLLESGQLNMEPLITHSYPLEKINEAFEAAQAKPEGYVKAIIKL